MKNKKKPARPDKSRPGSASDDAGNSMAPRESRRIRMSKAINPTHDPWLEIKVRRDANHQQPDLGAIEPIASLKVEHDAQAAIEALWRVWVTAAWSWHLTAVVIALGGATWGTSRVKVTIVPVAVALLLTLLSGSLNGRLRKWRFPNTLSTAMSLTVGISALTAAIWVSVSQLASGAPALVRKAGGGPGRLVTWLSDEPLELNSEDIDHYARVLSRQLGGLLERHPSSIASSAWSVASSVLNLVATILVLVFCLFFFPKDGRRTWVWFMRLLPVSLHEPVHEAGTRGWVTLRGYTKAQAMVAEVNVVFISTGVAFLGAGLVMIPLALSIFLASFIPTVGAVSTGAIAALVISLDQGLMRVIIMLIMVLAVQQIKSNVLQSLLMFNAVNIHPLVVLLAIIVGDYFASIIGALLVVSIVAFLNTVVLYLTGHDTMPQLADQYDRVGGVPGTTHAQIQTSYK